jgi:hypothetical protein
MTPNEALSGLPEQDQKEAHLLMSAMERIAVAPLKKQACNDIAMEMPGRRGWAAKSLRRKFRRWQKSGGDWRQIIDRTKIRRAAKEPRLAEEFLEYWRGLCQENQRKCRPAYRKLIREWNAGHVIPGYGTWRDWLFSLHPTINMPAQCPPDYPRGWSYENLMRHSPDAVELALARRGIAQAIQALPMIIRTRAGMRPLEYVVFDDWRSDFRVYAGIPTPCKVNGVLAMDVACALPLRFGLRPALPQEDDSESGIKRRDTRSIAAMILLKYGYPEDYQSTFIVENGTATITKDDAAAIHEVTEGHVKVSYTSMISGTVFGFADRALGNCVAKSWLESYFNLMHNDLADLPGQMGARYQLQPSELDSRVAHARALVKAGLFLPPALRNQLAIPFRSLEEAMLSHEVIFRWHRNRTEHALEAFEDVLEWRERQLDQWRPAHELVGASQEMQDRMEMRTRKESPLERFKRLSAGLTFRKVPMSAMPRLLEEHRWVSVEKPGELTFQIENRKRVWRDRRNAALQIGAKFLAYYNRSDLAWIHLTDGAGAYVASLPEVRAIPQGDVAALQEEIAKKQAHLNRKLVATRRRNPGLLEERLEQLDENIEVFEKAEAIELAAPVAGEIGAAPSFVAQISAVGEARKEAEEGRVADRQRISKSTGAVEDLLGRDEADLADPADLVESDVEALDEMLG